MMVNKLRLAVPVIGAIVVVGGSASPVRAQGAPGAILSRLAALEDTVAALQRTVTALETANASQAAALTELQTQVVAHQSTLSGLQLAVAAVQQRQPALRLTLGSGIVADGDAFRWTTSDLSGRPVWFNDPGAESTTPMWEPTRDEIIRIPKDGLYFVNVSLHTDVSSGIDEGRTLSLRRVGSNPLSPCTGGQVLAVTHDATYDPSEMSFPFPARSLRLTAALPLHGADDIVLCHSFGGGAFNRTFQPSAITSYLEMIFLAPLPQ